MSKRDDDLVDESNAFLDCQRSELSTESDRTIRRHDLYNEIDDAHRARTRRAGWRSLADDDGGDDGGEPRLIPAEDFADDDDGEPRVIPAEDFADDDDGEPRFIPAEDL